MLLVCGYGGRRMLGTERARGRPLLCALCFPQWLWGMYDRSLREDIACDVRCHSALLHSRDAPRGGFRGGHRGRASCGRKRLHNLIQEHKKQIAAIARDKGQGKRGERGQKGG